MAGLISRSLSATLKDRESPARVRFEGFRYFARRKWSWRRAAYTGMRLLHRPRGIDPPFDTPLPALPWLCTPCHKYPWIRVPLALPSRVLFFFALPPPTSNWDYLSGGDRVLLSLPIRCHPQPPPPSFSWRNSGNDCRGIPAGFEASDSGANLNCNQGWRVYIFSIFYWNKRIWIVIVRERGEYLSCSKERSSILRPTRLE